MEERQLLPLWGKMGPFSSTLGVLLEEPGAGTSVGSCHSAASCSFSSQ